MTLLVEDPINLRYFTGLDLSAGLLLEGEMLLVDGRYIEMAREKSSLPVDLFSWEKLAHLKSAEVDTTTITAHRLQLLEEKLPCPITPVPYALEKRRMIKRPEEVEALRKAAGLGSLGFDYACDLLEEGISEREIAASLEIFWLNQGAEGVAFAPTIAFGENSGFPHHHAGERRLKKGDTVLIDIGVKLHGYNSDMTRTLFFGEPNRQVLEIYEIVSDAFDMCVDALRPGITCSDLDAIARGHIEAAGHKFMHSLGHGLGLEVHEAPVLAKREPWADLPLEPGMVITVEPGIYVAGLGGVRLEDTLLVTPNGSENLSRRPKRPLCR